jgi:purine-binding chemotaxis protein CheW
MSSYCVFNIGDRRVGLMMSSVREIIERDVVSLTPVPLAPEFLRGMFNLRGQVVPFYDLTQFIGARPVTDQEDRAVIVEHGEFRFATAGRRIDTVEADESGFQPVHDGALHPALDAAASTERGNFEVMHLDRLEACIVQGMRFAALADAAARPEQADES